MRLGIFGGSFDPVHWGHLKLAACCQQQTLLDQLWFVPTSVQPLKHDGPQASNEDRCAMLRRALADQGSWHICLQETERGGISYTADTLEWIAAQQPQAEIFFLMGADTLHLLPRWKSPRTVCQLATPVVVRRPGEPEPNFTILAPWVEPKRIQEIERHQVEMPAMPICSSQIRQQAALGGTLEGLVPNAVAQYISEHRLYQESTGA